MLLHISQGHPRYRVELRPTHISWAALDVNPMFLKIRGIVNFKP